MATAHPTEDKVLSNGDVAAPASANDSSKPAAPETAPATSDTQSNEAATSTPASAAAAAASAPDQPVLSNAELKKRAKAEKAAKRAAARTAGGPAGGGDAAPGQAPPAKQQQSQKDKAQASAQQQRPAGGAAQGKQNQGQAQGQSSAIRRRQSQGQATIAKDIKEVKEKGLRKEVGFFGHLSGKPKTHTIEGAPKEVHPAVLALGLQMSSYVVCGSTARCVAMLLAFKSVSIPKPYQIKLSAQAQYSNCPIGH